VAAGSDRADRPLADLPVEVTVAGRELLSDGFRPYERYRVKLANADGAPITQERDVLRVGKVAAVLAVDPVRDEIIVIHQFRLAAHLAIGRGLLVEIVAGHVEPGEQVAQAAHRECVEEIGVAPRQLIELFTFLPTPGYSDEEITLFLGVVDASQAPARAGAAAEHEETVPVRASIDAALAAVAAGHVRDGPVIIALQWLALNRGRLAEIVRTGRASA
jgi:ADP-ribose pyrophosphatase